MKQRRVMVDFEAIWEAMDKKRKQTASPLPQSNFSISYMSWVELGKILETSDSQLANLKWRASGINAHTLLAIMKWLDRDLREFEK